MSSEPQLTSADLTALYQKGAEMPGGLSAIQAVTPQNALPGQKIPYYLLNGSGDRYLVGGLVVSQLARPADTGNLFEWSVLTGGKGATLPMHTHAHTHEVIYVLEGVVELWLNGEHHLLVKGDFASIPPTVPHGFRMDTHRNQLISMTSEDGLSLLYSTLGVPYTGHVQPGDAVAPLAAEVMQQAEQVADIRFTNEPLTGDSPRRVTNAQLPGAVVPYVLAAGEGDRYTIGDQLFTVLSDNASTAHKLLVVGTEGPAGHMIIKHFHQKHSESFFCVDGQMAMWANGSLLDLNPGDFLSAPAGTIHAYQFKSPYTRIVGMLTPGIFEDFFRSAHPYTDHVYPQAPTPGPNFAKISQLDLVFVERPGPPQ
ncbi:quercetin 2,3-dioxygenase [Rudanella lutea]|uniref:quercetin 2,3-dioxygenase n=1 Tax=Rudanella lutea TaxID=451374 RepID=UPI00037BA194|nr:quercetin 2,3-dioxygenase [Rudanella lutea]